MESFLCSNCTDADLHGAFHGNYVPHSILWFSDWSRGFYSCVRRKSDSNECWTWKEEQEERCGLCRLLNNLSKANGKDARIFHDECLQILSTSPLILSPGIGVNTDWGLIVNDEVRSLAVSQGSSMIESFESFKTFISECKDAHINHESCSNDTQMALAVPIKVIDCSSNAVVPAPPACKYLTLSYVWGTSHQPSASTDLFPRTIQDAITVTLALGYRFLWIDRYCIDQSNTEEKEIQIHQMDRIYANAEACLVAAAGDGPHHGLPGVSVARPISSQTFVAVEGLVVRSLVAPSSRGSSLGAPIGPSGSVWGSRAWTFQEQIFSRRRLYFTEGIVIGQCGKGWYLERGEIMKLDQPDDEKFELTWPPTEPFNDIYAFIELYSARELTYPIDVLRAFWGVAEAYSRLEPSVQQLWGIPMAGNVLSDFLCGLAWTWKDDGRTIQKRPGFPTWSWAGWICSTSYADELTEGASRRRELQRIERSTNSVLRVPTEDGLVGDIQVQVEDNHSKRFTLVDAWKNLPDVHNQFSRFIHLRAPGMDAHIKWVGNIPFLQIVHDNIDLMLRSSSCFAEDLWPCTEEMRNDEYWNRCIPCRVMFLGPPLVPLPQRLLVLNDVGTHWERVGLVKLDKQSVHKDFSRIWTRDTGYTQKTELFEAWLDGGAMLSHNGADFEAWVQSLPLALQEIRIG